MTEEAPPTKESAGPPPRPKKVTPKPQDKPQDVIRAWIDFRTKQLSYENSVQSISPIGGGNVFRGERQKVISVFLDELAEMATWLDSGNLEFIPPMNADQKQQWRFARDHGAEVPPHILEQL
jgi:hypothetical protein